MYLHEVLGLDRYHRNHTGIEHLYAAGVAAEDSGSRCG